MECGKITLSFGTRRPRDEAIQLLVKQTKESNISILNSRMFSNLSLVLELEGTLFEIRSLCSSLAGEAFQIAEESQEQIAKLAKEEPSFPLYGTIHVSFAMGDGSLPIPVPMVPG